jgi:hypothetical protein
VTYQEGVKVKGKKGEEIEVPILATRDGKQFAIALAGPLTPELGLAWNLTPLGYDAKSVRALTKNFRKR